MLAFALAGLICIAVCGCAEDAYLYRCLWVCMLAFALAGLICIAVCGCTPRCCAFIRRRQISARGCSHCHKNIQQLVQLALFQLVIVIPCVLAIDAVRVCVDATCVCACLFMHLQSTLDIVHSGESHRFSL
jgi:heme/copper-type cytochrome/quinol oxidase subunit 2